MSIIKMNIKKALLPIFIAGSIFFGANYNAQAQSINSQDKKINNPVLAENNELSETAKLNFFYEQDDKGVFVRMTDKPNAKKFIGNTAYDVPCTINDIASDVFKALNRGTSVNASWLEGTLNHVKHVELRDKLDKRVNDYLTNDRRSLEALDWSDVNKKGYSIADLIVAYNMTENEKLNNNLPQNMFGIPVGQKVYMPPEIEEQLRQVATSIVIYSGLDREELVELNKKKGEFQKDYFGETFVDTSKSFKEYPSKSDKDLNNDVVSEKDVFDYLKEFIYDFGKSGLTVQSSYDLKNNVGVGLEANHPSGLDVSLQYIFGGSKESASRVNVESRPHPFLPLTGYSSLTTNMTEDWKNGFNLSAEYPVLKENFGTFKAGLTVGMLNADVLEDKVYETYFLNNSNNKIDYNKNVKQGDSSSKTLSLIGPTLSFDYNNFSVSAKALFSEQTPSYSVGFGYRFFK